METRHVAKTLTEGLSLLFLFSSSSDFLKILFYSKSTDYLAINCIVFVRKKTILFTDCIVSSSSTVNLG